MPGFIDGLKKATGIGLSYQEQYKLGFEEGVLKKDYRKAAEYFHRAAEKAREKQDEELANRAAANKAIYQLLQLNCDRSVLNPCLYFPVWKLATGSILASYRQTNDPQGQVKLAVDSDPAFGQAGGLLDEAERALRKVKTIEKPLFQDQSTDPITLADECDALSALCKARQNVSPDDYMAAQALLEKLKDGNELLIPVPPSILAAICNGHAQFLQALAIKWKNPDAAGETIVKATKTFDRVFAKAEIFQGRGLGPDIALTEAVLREKFNELLEQFSTYAHCQLCGKQLQGKGVHYYIYKIHVSTYNAQISGLISEEQAEAETETHSNYEISVCESCSELIDRLAEPVAVRKANEALELARKYTDERTDKLAETVRSLENRLNRVERKIGVH
ncbi:MAG TPA: hypothetical protein VMC09_14135 [Anaerolineales bacterium]|nr:hypothetical protein [Anaerolineales bacterium]